MFLSRLIIRSINFIDINFTKGKNVIVGRNNAGKSNIIKAIDLILGESSPTYEKLENIKETDFYTGKEIIKSADEIVIYCELQREPGEPLNWELIEKAPGTWIRKNLC
ncbi:AAA family ATPase [Desulfonauticus submarinus]